MLSDNIRNQRRKINLSQEELAEKVGVSRQSVSFWETGQTQPTIDNIIALAKIFNISSDMLLENSDGANNSQDKQPKNDKESRKNKMVLIVAISVLIAVIIGIIIIFVLVLTNNDSEKDNSDNNIDDNSVVEMEDSPEKETSGADTPTKGNSATAPNQNPQNTTNTVVDETNSQPENDNDGTEESDENETVAVPQEKEFDLFTYCKNFAIEKGKLNGDYCIYQQPATKYDGYKNEYFSISYWNDSDMVEFCLHCPLDETYSHNFYLRMRGGYNHKYEYLSSKYFRDTGDSLRMATGYIDPSVFSDKYPISCDKYEGSADGQNKFMEDSRIGICDLILCLKKFVTVENLECDFSDFEFVNF